MKHAFRYSAVICLSCVSAIAHAEPLRLPPLPPQAEISVGKKPAAPPAARPNPAPEASAEALPEAGLEYQILILQGLNKVTGHISRIEAPAGTAMRFGNLEIIARRCWKAPPEDRPENAALLDVSELKPGEAPQRIFLGWMFSSSPGLSGLEHPVYDLTVLACETRKEPEQKEQESDEAEKEAPDKKAR